jgi:tetratricopeptide (TPR) repeat protein
VPVVKPLPRTVPEPVEPEPAVPSASAPIRRALPSVDSEEVEAIAAARSRGRRFLSAPPPADSEGIESRNESRGSASDSSAFDNRTRGESIELSADAVPVEALQLQAPQSAPARRSVPIAEEATARTQERSYFRERYGVDEGRDQFGAADENVYRDDAVEERRAAPQMQEAPTGFAAFSRSAPPAEAPVRARDADVSRDGAGEELRAAPQMQEAPAARSPAARMALSAPPAEALASARVAQEKRRKISPWKGKYAEFRALLEKGDAGDFVQKWHQEDLSNVMALIALGEWYEKTDNTTQAARAYGSLIDYFPARADIRRWAAERLLSIKSTSWLSIDSLKKAVAQRSDHPSGHYLLAIAHWEAGQYKEAVEILQAAIKRKYPRFAAANRILMETLALMLTRLEQQQQLETLFPGNTFKWEKATKRQLRLVLMWETDANDVDFHIYDNQQHHAYYGKKSLPTGGTLYADITTGYGPECFSVSEPKAFPYQVQAHYYRMGPMGYGMGILHVLDYDLKKGLKSEFRPFVVMKNGAFVELGKI